MRPRPRSISIAIACAALAGQLTAARAQLHDPFAAALPRTDTRPDAVHPGAAPVVDAQGAAAYSFPIDVPAGRRGMAPKLSLDYSSAGALRGGIAVGWSLALPVIERDPAFPAAVRYRSTLGGAMRLVSTGADPAGGTGHRAEVDGDFTRYVFDGHAWRAYTLDGVVRRFEDLWPSDYRWQLTSETDAYGNRVDYAYALYSTSTGSEQMISSIWYTSNAAAGLGSHARIDFDYVAPELCGGAPVGAQHDYHFDRHRYAGSQRLRAINVQIWDTATSSWRLARRYALGYDEAELVCTASALRYLTQIQVTAYDAQGVATTLPATRFGYGAERRVMTTAIALPQLPQETGSGLGPRSGFLDVNGDGVLDRVEVTAGTGCLLSWYRGLGSGQFATTATQVALPSAAWNNGVSPDPRFEGCTLAGQSLWRGGSGACGFIRMKVNYQFVDYDGDGRVDIVSQLVGSRGIGGDFGTAIFSDNGNGGGSGSGGITCADGLTVEGTQCVCPSGGGGFYDPILGCHSGCPPRQTVNLVTGKCESHDCQGEDCIPQPPGVPPPSCVPQLAAPETDGAHHLWRLQRNLGSTFEPYASGMTILAPLPLGGAPRENQLHHLIGPDLPALIDINGDGWLDMISVDEPGTPINGAHPTVGSNFGARWPGIYVWLGNGGATFASPVLWPTARWGQAFSVLQLEEVPPGDWTLPGTPGTAATWSSVIAVRDVNGDGLPDLIMQQGPGDELAVAYNSGTSFGRVPLSATEITIGDTSFHLNAAIDTSRSEIADWLAQYDLLVLTGARAYERRLLDLDGDGALESVFLLRGSSLRGPSTARVAFRLAGGATGVSEPTVLGAEYEPVESLVRFHSDGTWTRDSDWLDVTGDGLPDLVTWGASGATAMTDAGGPLHLLTSIDDGRGGVTRFDYARANDGSIVDAAGAPITARWVIRRITVAAGAGQPEQHTDYRYVHPRYGKLFESDTGAPGFRGFNQIAVETSGQLGDASKRVVRSYDYDSWLGNDHRGVLATELTSIKTAAGNYAPVHHLTHYYAAALVAGVSTATLMTTTLDRACAADATEISCANEALNLRRTEELWTPWLPPNSALTALWLRGETREYAGTSRSGRFVQHQYQVRMGWPYATTDYRTTEIQRDRGAVVTFDTVNGTHMSRSSLERTAYVLDAAANPIETRDYQNATLYATTRRTFDALGNALTLKRPNIVAVNGSNQETYAYDPFRIRVATRNDELGNTTSDTYEPATGALIRRDGPNFRLVCLASGACSSVIHREEWTIDGFGRPLEHRDSLDPSPTDTSTYVLRPVERFAYDDAAIPARRITTRYKDGTTTTAVIDEDRHDSAGKPIAHIARRQVAGEPDATTSFTYDAAGDLARVDAPDPGSDATPAVTSVARDGLGRPVLVARSDGSREATSYDGLTTQVDQLGDSGQSRTTLRRSNPFSELVEVRELDDPTPGAIATTSYARDARGQVTAITDADGVATALGYDWQGHRASLTRAGRTWTYDYDLDGNQSAVTEPVPAGAAAADYRSTFAYDLLDRQIIYAPAPRGLSPARLTELGIGTVTTTYNTSDALGKPMWISAPLLWFVRSYDARGNLAAESHLTVLGSTVRTESVARSWDLLGNPSTVAWDDGTSWRYATDARGAIAGVDYREPSTGLYRTLASYQRGVAGQIRVRGSAFGVERDLDRDHGGRVIHDRIWRPATGETLGERSYGFDGLGELRMVGGTLAGAAVDATYDHDAGGRVVRATGPASYTGAFAYSAAGNVRTASVTGAADAPSRDVTYAYGATDPQAVDRLVAGNGAAIASWVYDRSGNAVQRTVAGSLYNQTWDAAGALREVSGPAGAERYLFAGAQRIAAIGPSGTRLWFGESETQLSTTGAVVRRYHHVAAGEPIARLENGALAELQYADALGNLMLGVQPSGTVAAAFTYGAFGELVSTTGASDHHRRFNGKEHDDATGLRHYGYRSYDPVALRWESSDPLYRFAPDAAAAEPQRANLYAFALDNALRYVDPDGRDPCVASAYWCAFTKVIRDAQEAATRHASQSAHTGSSVVTSAAGSEPEESTRPRETNYHPAKVSTPQLLDSNMKPIELMPAPARTAPVRAKLTPPERLDLDEKPVDLSITSIVNDTVTKLQAYRRDVVRAIIDSMR